MGCWISGQNERRIVPDETSVQLQVKGHRGKVEVLYHLTSREVAAHLVFFGGRQLAVEGQGLLFVSSEERAKALGGPSDAVIKAYVRVGISVVVPARADAQTLSEIKRSYPSDSLLIATQEIGEIGDYVVYSWAKVCIVSVVAGGIPYYYEEDHEPILVVECENTRCLFTGKSHFGECRLLCVSANCLFFNKYHLGDCALPCYNRGCKRFGSSHMGSCLKKEENEAVLVVSVSGLQEVGGLLADPENSKETALSSVFSFF